MTLCIIFHPTTGNLLMDHFTVVRLASWPLNSSKAGGDLVSTQSFTSFVV